MKLVHAGALVAVLAIVQPARPAEAYSVLAHESNIDALWDTGIRPLLLRKFPRATRNDLMEARAYAYGGSVIQDLGYYPFGSHFFTNLLHYVRSGDFVETMIRDARTVNAYAFALGALAHYAADNAGHPQAVNRAVALMYPKLEAKYGSSVTYVESPAHHVIVEFSFDVVQAAAGKYASDAYHQFIGFKVDKPLLERAFRETYGLEMKDLFPFDEDLAIGTYRKAVYDLIPRITETAWRDKREEIEKLTPGIERSRFVFGLSLPEYEREYGADYKHPSLLARVAAFFYKLLPKIGPLKPLSFETPTPEAETLFLASLMNSRERYRAMLDALRDNRLNLPNTNFDTGRPSAHGEYALADDTYAELLERLDKRHFEDVPAALGRNITSYYKAAPNRTAGKKERHERTKISAALTRLSAAVH